MERRSFFKYAGAALTGGLLAGQASQAQEIGSETASLASSAGATDSRPEVRWRLASSFPRSLDTIFLAAESVAQQVSIATEGRFTIEVFAAGEVIPAFEVLDAVRDEIVEMAHSASYYFFRKNPVYAFDAAVPFGLNNRQMDAWYRAGNGLKLMRDFFAQEDIYNIPCGNTGTQMGGWFKKEIKSVEDLKGLRIRVGGFAGAVLSKLGALPQQIPGGEVVRALEQDLIDAAEWIGPHDDQRLGFQKHAPFYYYPGWWEGGTNFSMYINQKNWKALPASYQAILQAACANAHVETLTKYDARNPIALRSLLAAGTQIKPFPKDLMDAAFKAAAEVYRETSAKNPTFKAIFDDFAEFRRSQLEWQSYAESSFLNDSLARRQF